MHSHYFGVSYGVHSFTKIITFVFLISSLTYFLTTNINTFAHNAYVLQFKE